MARASAGVSFAVLSAAQYFARSPPKEAAITARSAESTSAGSTFCCDLSTSSSSSTLAA